MSFVHNLPEFSDGDKVRESLTLRKMMERYRDSGGRFWRDAKVPELSITSENDSIASMVLFNNVIGYPVGGKVVCGVPQVYDNITRMLGAVEDWIRNALHSGQLWCPPGGIVYTRLQSGWYAPGGQVPNTVSRCLDVLNSRNFSPLSVSTLHAALESEYTEAPNPYVNVYQFPRTTTPSTGLLGTWHNNLSVDVSPWEKDKEPDTEARSFKDHWLGFICTAHTAHTNEAGRSRRLTCNVEARVITHDVLQAIARLSSSVPPASESEDRDFLLYWNGSVCSVTERQVRSLLSYHKVCSLSHDPGFSFHLSAADKMCFLNTSSGVLVKRCSNGPWADSTLLHLSDRTSYTLNPKIDTTGIDFRRACLSPFYSTVPYIEQNRAIRTTISSAQLIQSVCFPWSPATAAISPMYVTAPIVMTPLYSSIMDDQASNDDVGSYLPGENMCVLYHNMPLTYEDSVVVSSKYRDMGGFATLSLCKYTLPVSEYVSPVGCMLCSKLSPWWKSRCQPHCKHTIEYVSSSKVVSVSSSPTGTVVSSHILKSGERSVRVRSFEQFQTGNKIATGHGQKGVATVIPFCEMPIVRTPDGCTIIPDMVMSVSSIIMRQTPGQFYEGSAAMSVLRGDTDDRIVEVCDTFGVCEDFQVMDSRTGKLYSSLVTKHTNNNPTLETTRATLGYVRVYNMTQNTREKHFTSHSRPGKFSLRTPVRRSRGGGVAWGEMEVQACVAAGLSMCVEELRKRGDEIVVLVCTVCQRLRLLHSCTNDTDFVEVSLPYDTVVLDCVNRIIHNTTFKYGLAADV